MPTPRIPEEKARSVMLGASLLPIGKYPGSQKKWPSICMRCGAMCNPRYNSIQQGQGGCIPCGQKKSLGIIETESSIV